MFILNWSASDIWAVQVLFEMDVDFCQRCTPVHQKIIPIKKKDESSKNLEDFTKIVGWVVWHPYLILAWLCFSEFEQQFHAPVLKNVILLVNCVITKTWNFSNWTWKNLENTWNFILTFVWPPWFSCASSIYCHESKYLRIKSLYSIWMYYIMILS